MTIQIIDVTAPADFDAVRVLCWKYRDFLMNLGPIDGEIVKTYYPPDKYQQILDELEVDHGPPNGRTMLAKQDAEPVGCSMWHRLFPDTAEIKRVYVTDAARGAGVARDMMELTIAQVKEAGLSRILLDTGEPLIAAQRLYESLGFKRCDFYYDPPEIVKGRLICYELTL